LCSVTRGEGVLLDVDAVHVCVHYFTSAFLLVLYISLVFVIIYGRQTDTHLIAVEVTVSKQRRLLLIFYSNSDCSGKYAILQLGLCLLFLKLGVFCVVYDELFLTKLMNFDLGANRRRGCIRLTLKVNRPNDSFTSFRGMKYRWTNRLPSVCALFVNSSLQQEISPSSM